MQQFSLCDSVHVTRGTLGAGEEVRYGRLELGVKCEDPGVWLGVVVKCEDCSERRVVPTPVRVFSRGSAAGGNSLVVAVEVEGDAVDVGLKVVLWYRCWMESPSSQAESSSLSCLHSRTQVRWDSGLTQAVTRHDPGTPIH